MCIRDRVLDAINVDVTVQYLPWSEYAGGKTELMLSSGEKFATYTDTAFLSKCVSKGYYADITDAAEKYAEEDVYKRQERIWYNIEAGKLLPFTDGK